MTLGRDLEPSAEHVSFGRLWTADEDDESWSVAWAPDTGELYAVDPSGDVEVLGVITVRGEVDELMVGWSEAQEQPGSLYALRHRVSKALHAPAGRAVGTSARTPGTRYRVNLEDGRWWELGWDRPLGTYYAELHDPVPYDPFTPPDLLAWHGTTFGELPDVAALEGATGLRLDDDVAGALVADQAAFPNPRCPTFLSFAEAIEDVPAPPREVASWLAVDPDRQGEHVELGSAWIGEPGDTRTLRWVPTTGEVYAVDDAQMVEVLGVLPSRPLLDAALHGALARHGVEGGLHWARATVRQAEEEVLFGRPGGWDDSYSSWVAAPARRVAHRDFGAAWTGDDATTTHRLSWVPTTGELYVTSSRGLGEPLVEVLGVFASAADVEAAVPDWTERMQSEGSLYWLRDSVAREIGHRFELAKQTPEALAERLRELDRREAVLDRRERQLVSQQAALEANVVVEPRWSLPAAPVAEILVALQAGTGDSMAVVATGCGLKADWAADVAAGRITEVDLPHIQEVCEGLHCSPYDLWGKDAAQGILHAYGPELWPRFIEPLEPPPIELPGPEPPPELTL